MSHVCGSVLQTHARKQTHANTHTLVLHTQLVTRCVASYVEELQALVLPVSEEVLEVGVNA